MKKEMILLLIALILFVINLIVDNGLLLMFSIIVNIIILSIM